MSRMQREAYGLVMMGRPRFICSLLYLFCSSLLPMSSPVVASGHGVERSISKTIEMELEWVAIDSLNGVYISNIKVGTPPQFMTVVYDPTSSDIFLHNTNDTLYLDHCAEQTPNDICFRECKCTLTKTGGMRTANACQLTTPHPRRSALSGRTTSTFHSSAQPLTARMLQIRSQ